MEVRALITTLHRYLGRDLVKNALLAAIAFTMVMTTFAIIEPLRKQGLSPLQAARLFWYLMPAMLSLTLPIAALFSATMVYGRFAQDNELTACKAGGIGLRSLVKPAVALAVVVSALSLTLSNWLAPQLARQGDRAAKANLEGMIYQKLRRDTYIRWEDRILHADSVAPEAGELRGVIAVDSSGATEYVSASLAYVDFSRGEDSAEVTFTLVNPTFGRRDDPTMLELSEWFVGFEVPMLFRDKTEYLDWATLAAIRRDPRQSPIVRHKLRRIYRQLHAASLFEEMRREINTGHTYSRLTARDGAVLLIRAPKAEVTAGKELQLIGLASGAAGADTQDSSSAKPVEVHIFGPPGTPASYEQADVPRKIVRAATALVHADAPPNRDRPVASIVLTNVEVELADEPDVSPSRMQRFRIGQLEIPPEIEDRLATVQLETLYDHPEQFPAVSDELAELRRYISQSMDPKILAEMHARIAYGAGCLLLIMAGAGLGLVFRGGQLLSAFALSCAPAMVLGVLTIMGKQMVSHPDVPAFHGLVAMWAGVGVLGCLLAYVYGVLLRR